MLMIAMIGVAAAQSQPQRLPRENAPSNAAIQGVIRTTAGLGLGGVHVKLRNRTTNVVVESSTSGDGVFRFLNLSPGAYQLDAVIDGFEPFHRDSIDLKA